MKFPFFFVSSVLFQLPGLGLCTTHGSLRDESLPLASLAMPLAMASPMPTAAPKADPELFKRAGDDSICGYISGVKTYGERLYL